MADYERILLAELGLHHLRTPNTLLRVGQVQIRRSGVPFGRFTLQDVFDGDFSAVVPLPPGRMAAIERTSSDTYATDTSAHLTGPFSLLARVGGTVAGKGAKHVQLSSLQGELVEIDQGALQRAFHTATPRGDGPLGKGDVAVVIVAVASVETFSVRFDDDKGGRFALDAQTAAGIAADIGASAELSKTGGLTLKMDSPMPFAARVWRVERKWGHHQLDVGTFKGPVELLGPSDNDPSFAEAVGLVDGVLELGV